jgi:hypothetical protein
VKVKKEKHVHTVVKPVHVHHSKTIIKEDKPTIIKEIHKPVEIHKEFHHKEVEYKKPPIYKEEISHEHLHHHYKHVHPEVQSSGSGTGPGFDFSSNDGSYAFQSSHP